MCWPIIPNRLNPPGFCFGSTTPASFASRVLTRFIGAPVSKISRYGPFPFTFTWTAMCRDESSSNGTTIGAVVVAAGVSAAFAGLSAGGFPNARAGAATTPASRSSLNVGRMVTAPSRVRG